MKRKRVLAPQESKIPGQKFHPSKSVFCRLFLQKTTAEISYSLLISRYYLLKPHHRLLPTSYVLSTQDIHIKLPHGCGIEIIFQARKRHNWPRL